MPTPAGPHFPVLFSATALVLFSPLELTAAETRDEVKQAIRAGLPRYDPAIHEKAQAERAARSTPRNAPAPLPAAATDVPAAAVSPAAPTPTGKIFELPKLTIRTDRDRPKPLPRSSAPKPLKDLVGEPWESPTGRDARLIEKHLNKLTRRLNSRAAQIALARQAEASEQRAAEMNDLAATLEMQAALGFDAAYLKQIRAEYLKLYYSGPK